MIKLTYIGETLKFQGNTEGIEYLLKPVETECQLSR